jgi:hypothetical protein
MRFFDDYLSKREDRQQTLWEVSTALGFILAWPVLLLMGQILTENIK